MARRISPTTSTGTRRTTKKSVSFGESTVHSVEETSHEDASMVWYNKAELDKSMQAERIGLWARKSNDNKKKQKQDNDGFTTRGLESGLWNQRSHVRHVVKVYHLKQKQTPNVNPEDLRKTSRHSSKQNAKLALEVAQKDFLDVYGQGSFLLRAKARMSRIFL